MVRDSKKPSFPTMWKETRKKVFWETRQSSESSFEATFHAGMKFWAQNNTRSGS
jgi:hypothetical protein